MYIVIVKHSFDEETPAYPFNDYDKARAYLHKLWEDFYNTEIEENEENLNKKECYHEDEYAKIKWNNDNDDQTEFILTRNYPYDKAFFEGDWQRYL